MKLSLQYFYEYMFGNRAEAVVGQKSQFKDHAVKKKHKEITDFFFGNGTKENPGLIPQNRRSDFSLALKKLNAKNVESVLYPSLEEKTTSEYKFPTDEKIAEIFKQYDNTQENFKNDPHAVEKFTAFFKVAKLIGDFVECNNDAANGNRAALLHAYKLLIVFGQNDITNLFKPTDKYLQSHNFHKLATPLHDALVFDVPRGIMDIHLPRWQEIIMKNGSRAFRLFSKAHEIEKRLSELKSTEKVIETFKHSENLAKDIAVRLNRITKQLGITLPKAKEIKLDEKEEKSQPMAISEPIAPKDFNEALAIAMSISYKKAKEYPELAKICMRYNLSEKVFEQCLKINVTRKETDNLPNIAIDGNDVNQPGYYLVKLPVDDPRAYLLGHITNCCQSIGGHSEQCVIDGVTLPDNGFYVLLKRTKPSESKESLSPFINNHINYSHYKIMGQGYAWLTQSGNLTFDSWENLQPVAEDKVIVPLLERFSHEATKNNSEILRVTIGTGGKTPEALKSKSVYFPEKMISGVQYFDSSSQGLIYCNQDKKETLIAKIKNIMLNSLFLSDEDIREISQNDFIYSVRQALGIQELLLNNQDFLREFFTNPKNLNILTSKTQRPKPVILFWDIAVKLHENKVINELNTLGEIYDYDIFEISDSDILDSDWIHFCRGLIALQRASLLTPERRLLLSQNSHYPNYDVSNFLIFLNDSKLLNVETYQNLVADTTISTNKSILDALKELAKANFLSMENINYILNLKSFQTEVAFALIDLHNANILNETIRKDLQLYPSKAEIIAGILIRLNEKEILNDDIYTILITKIDRIQDLGSAFIILKSANIFSNENRNLMINLQEHSANALSESFVTLHKAGILNAENKKALLDAGADHANLAKALAMLKTENILTDNLRNALYSKPKHANILANAFKILHEANLLTNENFKLMTENSDNSLGLAKGIVNLKQNNIYNSENINYLASNSIFSFTISVSFCHLDRMKLADKANKDLIIKNRVLCPSINRFLSATSKHHFLNDENFKAFITNSSVFFVSTEYNDRLEKAVKLLGLVNVENFADLMVKPSYYYNAAQVISLLAQANILNKETRQLCLQNIEKLSPSFFVMLLDANILTIPNFIATVSCMSSKDDPDTTFWGSTQFYKLAEEKILNDFTFNQLLLHPNYRQDLSDIYLSLQQNKIILSKESLKLFDDFIIKIEKSYKEDKIKSYFSKLHTLKTAVNILAKSNLLNNEKFPSLLTTLTDIADYKFGTLMNEIATTQNVLNVTPKIYQAMISDIANSGYVGSALRELTTAGLLTDSLLEDIITQPSKAYFYQYVYLSLHTSGLLTTNNNLNTILAIPPEQYFDVQYALNGLATHHRLTNETIKIVLDNYKFGYFLSRALDSFSNANILTNENFKFIIENLSYAYDLSKAADSKDQNKLDELVQKIYAESSKEKTDYMTTKNPIRISFFSTVPVTSDKVNTIAMDNINRVQKK